MNKRGNKEGLLLTVAFILFLAAFIVAFSAIEKNIAPIPTNDTNHTQNNQTISGLDSNLCADGIDNDGDGFTDYPADASCASREDNDELNPRTSCQDGLDNDNDGWIDIIDLGCVNTQDGDEHLTGTTQCSDELDNDFDTLIDGHDPECSDPLGLNESEILNPFLNTTHQCNDGIDNDGDSLRDWPIDPGCTNENSTEGTNPSAEEMWSYSFDGQVNVTNVIRIWPRLGQGDPAPWISQIKDLTDAMPPGHKVIQDWDMWGTGSGSVRFGAGPPLFANPLDNCRTSTGALTPYPCPWLDNGMVAAQEAQHQFWANYSEAGGDVDVVVYDIEVWFSSYILRFNPSTGVELPNAREHFLAIQSDPRNASLFALAGFDDFTLAYNEGGIGHVNYSLKFDDAIMKIMNQYVTNATYGVVKQYYPNVETSNFDYFHTSKVHGFNEYGGSGVHLGTHQQMHLYNDYGISGYNQTCLHPQTNTLYSNGGLGSGGTGGTCPPGDILFLDSPFHSFQYDINLQRMGKLSSSAPLSPVVGHRQYYLSRVVNRDLYQEGLLHYMLGGVDYLLYWNPYPPWGFSTVEDDILYGNTQSEFNQIAGFTGKHTLITTPTEWNADYVITGMQTGGRKVWRFTPNLDATNGNGLNATLLSESNNQVILHTQTKRITFTQAKIWRPQNPSSSQGYWIVQAANAPAPLVENA